MGRVIDPTKWQPIGIVALEPAADAAVRERQNCAVIAGPGAGKTELLAQRALFVLQTGMCPAPRRVLAITYKRDARTNLALRVEERCGPELARRFDAYTFDGFAKSVLDRFSSALPATLRPDPEYRIVNNLDIARVRRFLDRLNPPARLGTRSDLHKVDVSAFIHEAVHGASLSLDEPEGLDAWAAQEFWRAIIIRSSERGLTFPMIGRLAEYILRENPLVLRALRGTYSHVFLDEFQDATATQYSLLTTAFRSTECTISAVGDRKQRIMGWAGALDDALGRYLEDFEAVGYHLLMNHRSAPELVRIQAFLISRLDPSSTDMPIASDPEGEGSCVVLQFSSYQDEAEYLASEICRTVGEGLNPREICILVKGRTDVYSQSLIRALATRGLRARVESGVLELLSDPLAQISLMFLKIVLLRRTGVLWSDAVQYLGDLRGVETDGAGAIRVESDLSRFRSVMGEALKSKPSRRDSFEVILRKIMTFVDGDLFRIHHPQYRRGTLFEEQLGHLADELWKGFCETGTILGAIEYLEGGDAIPIMTIHKSKGLEYNTVYFLGLEDDAFWTFEAQSHEDMCAFFVAFSRAKRRVVFTFSEERPVRYSSPSRQRRTKIMPLYDILAEAGVSVVSPVV